MDDESVVESYDTYTQASNITVKRLYICLTLHVLGSHCKPHSCNPIIRPGTLYHGLRILTALGTFSKAQVLGSLMTIAPTSTNRSFGGILKDERVTEIEGKLANNTRWLA